MGNSGNKKVFNTTNALIGIGIIALVLISYFGFSKRFQNQMPKKPYNQHSFTSVSKGSVYQIIEAEGETAAENEVLILCPNSGNVEKVFRLPGNKVSKGEVILTLDKTDLENQLSNARDELDLLNNKLYKLKLSAKTTRIDLDHDIAVKKLKIASLKAELNDQSELLEVGGISQARIDKTKQEIVLAEKELLRSTQKHKIKLQQLNAEEEGILLQISMKEKQVHSTENQIREMVVKSPGTGIILEVRARKGENKKKNEILVRISEETRVKIKGKVSNKYSAIIRNGGKVFVDFDQERLYGVIGNIKPELENDQIQFDVFLENPHNENLKVNQRVKLFIVEREKVNVLRIEKGDLFEVNRSICYVFENGEMEKRDVKLGLKGIDHVEIVSGLKEGEQVVNSTLIKNKKKQN